MIFVNRQEQPVHSNTQTYLSVQDQKKIKPAGIKIVELLDLEGDQASQALTMYETAFSRAERLPVDNLIASLNERIGLDWINHFWILTEAETVLGLAIFSYFRSTRLALLKYLAIQSEIRGQGYGSLLFRGVLSQVWRDAIESDGRRPLGLCFEVKRPQAASNPEEQRLRQRRIAFYERQGAHIVKQINYDGPSLYDGMPPLRCQVMFRPIPFRRTTLSQGELATITRVIISQSYLLEPDDPYIQNLVVNLFD